MPFDLFWDNQIEHEDIKRYCYCLDCKIPMVVESKDFAGRPKYKCPNCGSVLNTAY